MEGWNYEECPQVVNCAAELTCRSPSRRGVCWPAHPDADTDLDAYTHDDTSADSDPHPDPEAGRDAKTDRNPHSYADSHRNAQTNSDSYTNCGPAKGSRLQGRSLGGPDNH